MGGLYQIQEAVRRRVEAIASEHTRWPCRKGCDDCCRHLASVPRVTRDEWGLISRAIDVLPEQTAELVRRRIRDSATAERPVICPLLDRETGACLIYEARPAACRAYGFYAEREAVLGCERIEQMGRELPNVVWGNQTALEEELRGLGEQVTLAEWDLRAGAVDCMVSS